MMEVKSFFELINHNKNKNERLINFPAKILDIYKSKMIHNVSEALNSFFLSFLTRGP